MKKPFFKMQGIGNDYLFFDCFEEEFKEPARVARLCSDRRFSVGGDGIILAERSSVADAKMRIFNADGSEGRMCGNGLRCFVKFLHEIKGIEKREYAVETRSGIRRVFLEGSGAEEKITADMGAPIFAPSAIPMKAEGGKILRYPLEVDGEVFRVCCLSMGNPHCVVFCEDVDLIDLKKLGPKFEHHALFPEGVNTEFVQLLSATELKMRVYERGSGETYACGTGACAAAVAAIECGYCLKNTDLLLILRGGTLTVRETEETVFLTGPAAFSFTGIVEI